MFQAQNRETINSTWKVAVSFKIIVTTSLTRSCFTTQHQTCKTKTKTNFFRSGDLRQTVSDHITGIGCLVRVRQWSGAVVLITGMASVLKKNCTHFHLPPVHHCHPPSHTHCFIPGSELTFSTNLLHHILLAPTWTSLLGLYWTGLTLLNGFHFYLFFIFYFNFILSRAVDWAGLTASLRAHVNIVSLLTYLSEIPSFLFARSVEDAA